MTQKTTPTATFATFNLHIIHLTLPYIFHTHSPQNTHTYLSCTFKFHVSQSIYIYIYHKGEGDTAMEAKAQLYSDKGGGHTALETKVQLYSDNSIDLKIMQVKECKVIRPAK